jgi:uncharacterized protein YukE
MSGLQMPAGDPAALEAAAAALGRYAGQVGDLAGATHRSTTGIAADGDWTGGAADAYTAYTGGLVTGVAGMEQPLGRVPAAVAGYAAALRAAQARVGAYQSYARQVSTVQGPISRTEAAQIQTQAQELETYASEALTGLEEAARQTGAALNEIAQALNHVFDGSGPFHSWLENITRPWDSSAGDAFLEALLLRGEKAEKVFEEAAKAAKEGKQFLEDLPAKLDAEFEDIVGGTMQEMLKGNAGLAELEAATERWQNLRDAAQTFAAGVDDEPAESTLLRLLPGLKAFDVVSNAASVVGGAYLLADPPEYDHGALRAVDRVAGVASIASGGIGLAVNAGVDFTALSVGAMSLSWVPVVGTALGVGAGLFLAGDWAYHHTHQIAHAFDVARHTVAHVADDVGHGLSTGLSDITGGLL